MDGQQSQTPNSIEEAYLIHHDGRVMAHASKGPTAMDKDLVGGMLNALTSFVGDSFGFQEDLKGIDFGSSHILLEKCSNSFLVAVIKGQEPGKWRPRLKATSSLLELEMKGTVENWDGNRSQLSRLEEPLKTLLLPWPNAAFE